VSLLPQDLRFTFRQLRNKPGFSVGVVLTLALGIGAATAVFSLVEGILLRPLPFHDPDRLVVLGDRLGNKTPNAPVTAREIGTYSAATSAFSSMGGYITAGYELSGGAIPETIRGARLTAGVFPTLGVNPILGRVFTEDEEQARQPLAVISYALWLERFHRDPHAIGGVIDLDRRAFTIIGVMPRDFEFPLQTGHLDRTQLWVPMSFTADELSDASAAMWGYHIVARLKDGSTLSQAKGDANRVAQQIMRGFPTTLSALHIEGTVTPLRDYTVANSRPLLRTLFLAVCVVLVIACINVAGLLLLRAIRRRREHAVRLALGAGSGVIVRGAVLEGLILSIIGGLLGLALAAIVVRTALYLLPETMPRIDAIAIDTTVSIFALVLAIVTGIVCSLAPAFAALRTNLIENLKEGVRATGQASHAWLRSALIVFEIGIALVLLTVSGAFIRSLQKMQAVDPGFRPENVLVASYRLPLYEYPTEESVIAFKRVLVQRLASTPGVIAAGLSNALPVVGGGPGAGYTVQDQPLDKWKLKFAMFALTYGDYFRAMGIPLLAGRYFNETDNANAPLVVIVNDSFARHAWPGQSAIGKRFHIGNPKNRLPWLTVVGVVADTKIGARDEPNEEQWYTPQTQPAALGGDSGLKANLPAPADGYIALRSALAPEQMIHTLRSTVADIDPVLPLREIRTMTEAVSNIEAPRRFNTDLISAFAIGALLLAVIGIYAVIAFSVSLRSQEIAVRMALGAQRMNIVRLVLSSGIKLALAGCALGVLGSFAAARLVGAFLFQESPTDPLIYFAGVAIMVVMAVFASAIPARRAASADPIGALRAV
jgi:putative ABC transport system permease protein